MADIKTHQTIWQVKPDPIDGTPRDEWPETHRKGYFEFDFPRESVNAFKDFPNVNEMWHYYAYGDAHYDDSTPWSMDGGLTENTGGLWLKKKQTILSENLPFSDAVGIDGKDMRIETTTEGNNIRATKTIGDNLRKDISIGVPAQKQNYFFLPAIVYNNTTLTAAPANGNWIYYGCSSQALYIHYQPTYGYNSSLGTWCIMFKRSDNSAQLWTYVGYNQPLPAGPIVASWFK